jgi:hydroxymethylglutaryl-CoA synthase
MAGELGSLVGYGAYIPRWRLSRARIKEAMGWLDPPGSRAPAGERAVCNWDEDALTLAVEAARSCLSSNGTGASASKDIGAVTLASTTLPFADRSNATLLAGALDLPATTETLDVTGTLRSGITALVQAARRSDTTQTLVVASDARVAQPGSAQELELGAAAAAFAVRPGGQTGSGEPAIAVILSAARLSADFVDHYRMREQQHDYTFEERWVRDEGFTKLIPGAIREALSQAGLTPADVHHCVLPGNAAAMKRVLQTTGLTNARLQTDLREACGDSGTASALLMLASALEAASPQENILVVSFGQGVEVLLLRVPGGRRPLEHRPVSDALHRRKEEASYTRYLSNAGLLQVDFGMRAERDNRSAQSVAWRKHRQITGFVGGRCSICGTVQFPLSRVCVNPECRKADTQSEFRLAEMTGRVKTFTEDWQAFSPRPPNIYGNIEFEPGGNLLMELTDLDPNELQVGDRVRFVFRIKDVDRMRGFQRYFWKATRI